MKEYAFTTKIMLYASGSAAMFYYLNKFSEDSVLCYYKTCQMY